MLKEKKPELIEFGKKLYKMRKSKRMTQMQMGEALGVDNRMISRYETGEAESSVFIGYWDTVLVILGSDVVGDGVETDFIINLLREKIIQA